MQRLFILSVLWIRTKQSADEYRSVRLVGPFNDWNELTLPLHWENGRWVIRLDLEPGTYPYYFVVDRVRTLDPKNPETTSHEGKVMSEIEIAE